MGKTKSAISAVAASVVFLTAPAAAAGTAVGPSALAATCTTSTSSGSCGPYLYPQITSSSGYNTYVNNEVWNAVPGWKQTLTATDPGNWSVTANMPAGDTAVVSYPDTQQLYSENPLSSYTSLTSRFSEALNPNSGTMAEAAYDIWCNNWASEIMVWTDNHGQSLAYDTNLGTATIAGQSWTIYRNGGPGSELIVSLNGNEQTGTVDILATLNYLMSHGWLTSGSTLTGIDFGFEFSSTGGQDETASLSSFSITENGGGAAPVATTNAAANITASGATLNGSVNPEGQSTTYQFDYGTTTGYGTSVPSPAASAGSGTAAVNESQAVSGLQPSTTYHYRVEATNAATTSYGPDRTFTTSPTGKAVRFDATARAKKANASTLKWTHTVGAAGVSRALLVEATVGDTNDVNCHQTVKDGSVTLKKLAIIHTNGRHAGYMGIWGLANPRTGANSLSFTVSGCDGGTPKELTAGSISFTRVNHTTPFSAVKAATGHSAAPSATIASTTGNLVAGFLANGSAIRSATSPSVSRFVENENNNTGAGNSAGATSVATGSKVTMRWAVKSGWWGEGILQVNHA
jgi:hypothetical protein